jgi:glycosyltransferase involved in cell wall biosynthesis
VHYLGKVPFNDIINLYRHARFFITATLYESSSLPILEAAASGTPIIASKTPPNEEMGSILDLNLFDPLDVDNLCHLIYSIWNRDSLIQRQIEHNRHNINYYSWDSAAKKYMEVFSKITQ